MKNTTWIIGASEVQLEKIRDEAERRGALDKVSCRNVRNFSKSLQTGKTYYGGGEITPEFAPKHAVLLTDRNAEVIRHFATINDVEMHNGAEFETLRNEKTALNKTVKFCNIAQGQNEYFYDRFEQKDRIVQSCIIGGKYAGSIILDKEAVSFDRYKLRPEQIAEAKKIAQLSMGDFVGVNFWARRDKYFGNDDLVYDGVTIPQIEKFALLGMDIYRPIVDHAVDISTPEIEKIKAGVKNFAGAVRSKIEEFKPFIV